MNKRRSQHETSPPGQPLGSTQVWLPTLSDTGQQITPGVAIAFATVYACWQLLADSVAGLPWEVYRRTPSGREVAYAHPNFRLLDLEPNPDMDSFIFRQSMMISTLSTGNAYAQIEKDGKYGAALHFLRPDRMTVLRQGGEIVYQYAGLDVAPRAFTASEIFHIKAIGFDGLVGLSPLAAARNAIGTALGQEGFAASFFRNGARPSGVLAMPGKLDVEGQNRLRSSWEGMYAGRSNAGRVAILEQGLKWQPLSIPADDAQFLESRQFQRVEICSMFRVPPHMIGDQTGSSYSNNEQANTEFVQHTLRSWVKRWELEAQRKLFGRDDVHYSRMRFDDLLRGDTLARAQSYEIMKRIGSLNVNEIRAKEDLNSIGPEGEVYTMSNNEAPVAHVLDNPPDRKALPPAKVADSVDDSVDLDDDGIAAPYADWATETVERLLNVELTAIRRKREGWVPNSKRFADGFMPILRSAGVAEPEKRSTGVASALCEWMGESEPEQWMSTLPVRAAESLLRS